MKQKPTDFSFLLQVLRFLPSSEHLNNKKPKQTYKQR